MIRRIITGHKDGKAVFLADGPLPRHHIFEHTPGMEIAFGWSAPAVPRIADGVGAEPVTDQTTVIPPAGESRLIFLKVPPQSWAQTPDFDPVAAGTEIFAAIPDIAATFEADGAMHTTDSVDYVIVLEGEVHLELDDQQEVVLGVHDVVVQVGTRHAWRNTSDKPALLAVVLIGAGRDGGDS